MLEYNITTEQELSEALEALNEAYFGKSKELLEIEKLLDQYRKKYLGKYIMIGAAANTDKLLVKINRLFEKQFGFGDFALFIIDTGDVNAFTFSISNDIDINVTDKKLANEKTFKFNKDANYAVITCIFAGLIFNPGFKTDEILGIILHEIGHNFYAALSTTNTIFTGCDKAIGVVGVVRNLYTIFGDEKDLFGVEKDVFDRINAGLDIVEGPLSIQKIKKPIVKSIKEANAHRTKTTDAVFNSLTYLYLGMALFNFIGKIYKIVKFVTSPAIALEKVIKKIIFKIIDPIHILRLPNGFRNERTADNFATMYGYGPALYDALGKMEMVNYNKRGSKEKVNIDVGAFCQCLLDTLALPYILIMMAFDPHPLTIQRTTDSIRMLDEELNKSNLDPKMKKRIQKDINKMNNSVNKFIDTSKSIGTDPDFVKHIINRIMYNTVEAKSFRDIIFNFDPNGKYKSYDKVLDELCEENKK